MLYSIMNSGRFSVSEELFIFMEPQFKQAPVLQPEMAFVCQVTPYSCCNTREALCCDGLTICNQ